MEETPGTPGTQPPAPLPGPPEAGDVVGLGVMGLFFVMLLWLGVAFIRKKRRENLETLTRELEKPSADDEERLLPEGETPLRVDLARTPETVPVRPADDAETRQAYARGLEKTRSSFFSKLTSLLSGTHEIDEKIIAELEPLLIQADVGVKTTDRLLAIVKEKLGKKELGSADKVKDALREEILRMVNLPAPPLEQRKERPCVVMVIGVNGAGKTTTIGKLASKLRQAGHKVVLGAGDTFRAAAVEQLKVWGDRAGCETVEGKEGQDPASVIFEAARRGKEVGADFILADTAGRLHTKVNLMEELKKVSRVVQKAVENAPHEVLLVLDATTGQNALIQAEQFNQALPITGIALTKLDGTAKGGIIVAICDQLKLPIRYVGVGEKLEDLRVFDAKAFVDGLFGD